MAIIGISGKKQHGKDTVANIIQCLTAEYSDEEIIDVLTKKHEVPDYHLLPFSDETTWEKRQFAYKLKKIVCELIGCTMEQLEDNTFKETILGEEWRRYYFTRANVRYFTKGLNGYTWENDHKYFSSLQEAEQKLKEVLSQLRDHSPDWWEVRSEVLTPRLLLQLMGTECGRQIIHPNIWCNSLFSEYYGDVEEWKPIKDYEDSYEVSSFGNVRSLDRKIIYGVEKGQYHTRKGQILEPTLSNGYPTVSLSGNTFTVHDLVGRHFLNKPEVGYVLNHIDYNKENNFYKNLEYVTQGDNVRHNYKSGRANIGVSQKDSKLNDNIVRQIRVELQSKSQAEVARQFNISTTTINDIVKKRKWNHVDKELEAISPILPIIPPNWIITDVRFPNEAEAIKKRSGIIIRVNRPGMPEGDNHPSETSLDDYKGFDWVFSNNSNLKDLILKTKTILDHYGINYRGSN